MEGLRDRDYEVGTQLLEETVDAIEMLGSFGGWLMWFLWSFGTQSLWTFGEGELLIVT